jgi:hypothetical protein
MRNPKAIKVIGLLLTVVVIATGTAACSDDSSDASTTTTTTTVKAKNFEVSTPDGQVSLSLDGQLPPGWPTSFPVPTTTEAAGSGSLEGSTSGYLVAVYTSTGSGRDAFDFYTSQTALKPTDEKSLGSTNFVGTMKIASPDTGSITVTEVSGTTYIVVILKTSGNSTSTTASSLESTTTTAG